MPTTDTLSFSHTYGDPSARCVCRAPDAEAAEEGRSAWFYCKAGKDRTGLVAMLTLSVMGASEEDIVEDYYASHVNRKVALGDIAKESELKKLDKEVFSGAPRESMQHTLRWVVVQGSLSWGTEGVGVEKSQMG